MGKAATEQEKLRQAKARLRRIQHYEQLTKNVSQTCRFFGISRGQFYIWLRRYRQHGLEELKNLKSGAGGLTCLVSSDQELLENGVHWALC
jgi:transposase-like protein